MAIHSHVIDKACQQGICSCLQQHHGAHAETLYICMRKPWLLKHRFNQMTAPRCLQAEAFHPCNVRFYFSTGRLRGLELAATPAFPLLHGNCNSCAQCGDCTLACKHNLGQDPGSASETHSKLQSFLIPPTFCIEGKFEVCFASSQT